MSKDAAAALTLMLAFVCLKLRWILPVVAPNPFGRLVFLFLLQWPCSPMHRRIRRGRVVQAIASLMRCNTNASTHVVRSSLMCTRRRIVSVSLESIATTRLSGRIHERLRLVVSLRFQGDTVQQGYQQKLRETSFPAEDAFVSGSTTVSCRRW